MKDKPVEVESKKRPPLFEVLVKVEGEYINIGALWEVELKNGRDITARKGYSMRLKPGKFPKEFDGSCLVVPVRR